MFFFFLLISTRLSNDGEIAVGVRKITDPLKPHIFSLSFNAKVMSIVRFDHLLFEVRSYPALPRHSWHAIFIQVLLHAIMVFTFVLAASWATLPN
jgi:hypothetical protein